MSPWLLLWGMTSHAATLTVDPATSGAYPTIGDAISAAETGDTLSLASGTFTECIDTAGKDLTIEGPTTGAPAIIDGTGLCTSAITVQSGETVVMRNLHATHGDGRAFSLSASTLSLASVEVSETGTADLSGGAIYAASGTLNTSDCTFTSNTGWDGGAIYLDNGVTWTDTGSVFTANTSAAAGGAVCANANHALTLSGSQFDQNIAGTSGGAIVANWYSSLSIDSVAFTENVASYSGGAIFTYVLTGAFNVESSDFIGNEARDGWGGAIEVEWYSLLNVLDSRFESNSATAAGGAISQWYETSVRVEDSTFVGNTASASGGAMYWNPYQGGADNLSVSGSSFRDNTSGSWGGAIYGSWANQIAIEDSTFDNNLASGNGGGFAVYVTTDLQLHRNRFCSNTAYLGGGAQVEWATSDTIDNNVFIDNGAERGGGLFRYSSYDGRSSYNSFVGNVATWGGAFLDEWGTTTLDNSAFFHNDGGAIFTEFASTAGSTSVQYDAWGDNAPQDGTGYFWVEYGTDGNVTGDSDFARYTPGGPCAEQDLHPLSGSVLLDAADPSDIDLDGSPADIGAFGGPGAPLQDHDGDGFLSDEDCQDGDPTVFPGADEICDGTDNNCDGTVDGSDATDAAVWYADLDGDGYGDATTGTVGCGATGMVTTVGDCDDTSAEVHPDAVDTWYDGIDQDCDGRSDFDADRDGHEKPVGDNGGRDCDDADPSVYPGAEDPPGDGIDQDCDGADDAEAATEASAPLDGSDANADKSGCATMGIASGVTVWTILPFIAGRRRRADR